MIDDTESGQPALQMSTVDRNEMGNRLLQQVFEIWVNPEIEKRQREGLIASPFPLYMAQVVFDLDVERPIVRLNQEVQAVMNVRATRAVQKGEAVSWDDFSEIASIELTDRDPNAGHITVVLHQDVWVISFNARYNAQRVAQSISTAKEFLASAQSAFDAKLYRPLVDNLFSAVECLAKAILLSLPDKSLMGTRTHATVQRKFNWWSKLGNIEQVHAALLNELKELRKDARYTLEPWSLSQEHAERMISGAEELLRFVEGNAPQQHFGAD